MEVQDQGASRFSSGEVSLPGLQRTSFLLCVRMDFPWHAMEREKERQRDTHTHRSRISSASSSQGH